MMAPRAAFQAPPLLGFSFLVLVCFGPAAGGGLSPSWHRERCHVLLLSQRGGGDSGGNEDVTEGTANLKEDPKVDVLDETVLWRGKWRSMLQRTVTLPGAAREMISFDVVASNHGDYSVLVLAWDSASKTATLIREYHPGPNEWQYGVVAGGYEKSKHGSPLDAARSELEEEARMVGGAWTPLLSPRDDGDRFGPSATTVAMDKYNTNRFYVFLAIDCERMDGGGRGGGDAAPELKPPDDEESIRVVHGVTAAELKQLVLEARFNVPSSYAVLLALDALREKGYLDAPEKPPVTITEFTM